MSEAWKAWERTIVSLAQDHGLPWERRLRLGDNHDLLDVDGCLPGGWLVGAKSIRRGVSLSGGKLNDAMHQSDRALLNLARPALKDGKGRLLINCGGIIPVQVIQRSGYPASKAYAVTEYGYFLELAAERQEWRKAE
jgi:hypothetical protein